MEKKEIVLSGIRPTGNLHLGNYFGAVKNFVKMQETHTCFFFIADYHSLTTHPTPGNLQQNVRQVLVEYLAAGLDPEKATLYLQSDLPETAELYLFLNMNAYMGELERVTTFKEKARKQPDNINAGLLTYPTLMAADIIIHKANKVPVGKDQEQNLEMARTFARRFNHMYHVDFFPQPSAFNFGEELVKIPGLDGSGKMGKSEGEGNAIFLMDDPKVLRKKVMRAVSDSGPTEMNQVKPEPIENLFSLLKVVSQPDVMDYFNDQYNNCNIRYGDLKKQLADDMIAFTEPFRDKIAELTADQDYITRVMNRGAEKARESGRHTVEEVRQIIGFRKYYPFT
ncbi:MAG: tryptophan--tRNA ligase [Bacteroidetes bacterium GWF2_41_31]|nr:MAG: tryptophan--tRNA ligase [Bacteroidetes bacterium GWF2_41_31]OFZ08085.1 MAG: tryptophan--tRNA ligase [Bacteroidetes bacterium RIFOXYB12_FULL_41_6]